MQKKSKEDINIYEIIFNTCTEGIFVVSKSGNIEMVNPNGEQMFGYKKDEVIRKKVEFLIPTNRRKKHLDYRLTYQKHNRPRKMGVGFDLVGLKKDGSQFPVEVSLNPTTISGKPMIIVFIIDISIRKKTEEDLRKSESMLIEAERVANTGSWEFVLAEEIIRCSHEAARILGVRISEHSLSYKTFINSCHKEDRKMLSGLFNKAIMDGESFIADHRVIQAGGSLKWVQSKGRSFQNGKGDIEKIVGTIQDITEQKRNQQKLEKNRQLLKEAQSIAQIGSFDWNIAQNILNCTDEFFNIFKIDQKGFWPTFENYLERIHPYDRELTRKQIFESLATAETYDIEHRVLLPDNTIKNVRTIGRFKTDDQNQPERLLVTIQDVTEKKRAEDALLHGQELERRRIAMEIHDGVGQMLAATKFNINALDGMPAGDVESHLNGIHELLEKTIDETRLITKSLSANILQELGLKKAINELCAQAQKLVKLDLVFLWELWDDEMQTNIETAIYRVTQEAINNMVKYSKATKGVVKLFMEENYFVLTIEDNGVGFDKSLKKFEQGNGLINMRQRVKLLHGHINMESSIGKGTCINIRIPLETKPLA